MTASIILGLLGRAAPAWLTKPIAWAIDLAIIAALLGGLYLLIFSSGAKSGAAKVTAQVVEQHAARVKEARDDERTAQGVTDQIGRSVTRSDQATTDLLRSKLEEMRHVIDPINAAPAGDPAAVLDTDRLSASANAVIDRANRAADAADAGRGTDEDRAADAP